MRHENERICNEIHLKYKNKMLLLRQEMENKRKDEIRKIQEKKDAAIAELTSKHTNKYADIKAYYMDITNTNLDIINQLKEELNEAKDDDNRMQKQKMDATEKNNEVVEPLTKASEEVKQLSIVKVKYDKTL